jgi:intracellular sulfur oxidation DsrE/DsrF family protein
MRAWTCLPSLLAVAMALAAPARAADDRDVLKGVKELKAVFDIREGDGRTLLNRLMVIEETRESLIAQGVAPRFILTFRGPATRLIQTDPAMIRPGDREVAAVIATKLDEMRDAKGVEGIELCEVAIRGQGTKAENVIPAVKIVGNTFTSLMAWQARGYAYISP